MNGLPPCTLILQQPPRARLVQYEDLARPPFFTLTPLPGQGIAARDFLHDFVTSKRPALAIVSESRLAAGQDGKPPMGEAGTRANASDSGPTTASPLGGAATRAAPYQNFLSHEGGGQQHDQDGDTENENRD